MDVLVTIALVALVFWAVALGGVTFARVLVGLLHSYANSAAPNAPFLDVRESAFDR
jgi:hypothetical protein